MQTCTTKYENGTADFSVNENRSGILVEHEQTSRIFINPKDKRTERYLNGRFG